MNELLAELRDVGGAKVFEKTAVDLGIDFKIIGFERKRSLGCLDPDDSAVFFILSSSNETLLLEVVEHRGQRRRSQRDPLREIVDGAGALVPKRNEDPPLRSIIGGQPFFGEQSIEKTIAQLLNLENQKPDVRFHKM